MQIALLAHPRRLVRHLRYSATLRRHSGDLQLHLGCGQRRIPGFVNIDCNHGEAVDYVCDIGFLPCPVNSVSRIESYHVFEHIPHRETQSVLTHWYSVLEPGGMLVIECPDFDRDVQEYMAGNEDRLSSIFGRQRFPGDTHYFGYNSRRLAALLESAGFSGVVEKPPDDYHAKSEPCLRFECHKPFTTDAETTSLRDSRLDRDMVERA